MEDLALPPQAAVLTQSAALQSAPRAPTDRRRTFAAAAARGFAERADEEDEEEVSAATWPAEKVVRKFDIPTPPRLRHKS
jgi:hypothetical protein